ncbi:MAG: hypothetical protein J1F63_01060 [Oscillospiraceae bacterium]|nr:hypothetical protein [Oscillospiraceae bacterium]
MKKLLLFILLLLTGCTVADNSYTDSSYTQNAQPIEAALEITVSRTEEIMSGMSLEDKLWQLFFVTPEAISETTAEKSVSEAFVENAQSRRVGGIILFADNISSEKQILAYTEGIKNSFTVPVFIGVDEEGGTVSRLGKKGIVTNNGNMRDIGDSGDPAAAAEVGERLGRELSALGFNLDFAPVADVITNSKNTEIGRRSFGTDAVLVSQMVAAETETMQSAGVSAVLKHFPGHGSTSVNSHNKTSVSERTFDELTEVDIKPFKAGIEAGADLVMISHMSLPGVTGNDRPCSLSPMIITDILRGGLGYNGVVITDALNMGAVSNLFDSGEAAVLAILAGADMLLMPEDLDAAYAALLEAVESGLVSEERIDESVKRILMVKEKRGII